jgi:hypothetical protein
MLPLDFGFWILIDLIDFAQCVGLCDSLPYPTLSSTLPLFYYVLSAFPSYAPQQRGGFTQLPLYWVFLGPSETLAFPTNCWKTIHR